MIKGDRKITGMMRTLGFRAEAVENHIYKACDRLTIWRHQTHTGFVVITREFIGDKPEVWIELGDAPSALDESGLVGFLRKYPGLLQLIGDDSSTS